MAVCELLRSMTLSTLSFGYSTRNIAGMMAKPSVDWPFPVAGTDLDQRETRRSEPLALLDDLGAWCGFLGGLASGDDVHVDPGGSCQA